MRRFYKHTAIGIGYWLLDALVHSLFLTGSPFSQQLFVPTAQELYSRIVVLTAILIGVVYYDLNAATAATLEKEKTLSQDKDVTYKTVFKELDEGLAIREIMRDQTGKPVDYRFLDVNPAFEKLTGLEKQRAIRNTGKELFPLLGENLLETFVQVVLTRQSDRCEEHIPDLNKHFHYTVFSLSGDRFATLMIDVSGQKQKEKTLRLTAVTETAVAQISKILVSKESEEITDVLKIIAQVLGLECCAMLEVRSQRTVFRVQSWSEPDTTVTCSLSEGFDLIQLKDDYEKLKAGECVCVKNADEYPFLDEKQKANLAKRGVTAWALAPIMHRDRLVGLLNIAGSETCLWPFGQVPFLTTVCEVMATYYRRLQAERRMQYLTYHDLTTLVPNRTYFQDKLLPKIASLETLSVIMGDLNGLKSINDTMGHLEGDRLIIAAAKAFKAACSDQDEVIRWGGDEFVVILPNSDEKAAAELCRKINDNCAHSDQDFEVSISLGHATRTNSEESVKDLISKAEDRMYLHKLNESRSSRHSLLRSLDHLLEEMQKETKEHCDRIRDLCIAIGKALGMAQLEINALGLLASFHDIGKIGIPNCILFKTGQLTEEEWAVIKKHPELGHHIAKATGNLAPLAEGILYHHECWDGTGYPSGISGTDIPLMSRIIAVADAFDAMTQERPYRKARSVSTALAELRRCSGS